MDFPVFGHNVGVAPAVQTARLPAATAPATAPTAAAAPVSATTPAANPNSSPVGFLELARQIQTRGEDPNASTPRQSFMHAAFGNDGFGFDDFVDIINPLQHIPIVSTIYRAITGDKIDPGPELAGGALYGGFFGLMSAAVNVAFEQSTGHDIGDTVRMALFGNPSDTQREPVLFAGKQSPGPGAQVANAAPAQTAALQTDLAPASGPSQPAPDPAASFPASAAAGGSGGAMPALTPEQLSLLQEREKADGDITPASGPVEAPALNAAPGAAPPKPGQVIDLTPAQEALLLKSLGIAPPEKTGDKTAPKSDAPAAPAAQPVPPVQAKPLASATPAVPGPSGAPAPSPVPQITAPVPPPIARVGNQADFAKRMQQGLDRYFAHRTAINTRPPHLDVIR